MARKGTSTSNRKSFINQRPGAQGLNLFDPAQAIREFQGTIVTSMNPTLGGVSSRYGYELFNGDSTKDGGITMLHGFKQVDGTKQIIFANDDDYYHIPVTSEIGTAWNTVGSMGTAVATPHAYTIDNKVIFGTGLVGNIPNKWDGSSFSPISTKANGNNDLLFFEFFQGQDFAALFGAGDPTKPSRLYYSDANDPDNWGSGSAGFIDIAADDGYEITGLKTQGNQLIVYKNKHRYYISTFYESNTGLYGVRVSPFRDNSGGSIAHDTIKALFNGDIVSLAQKGIGLQSIGKLQAADGSLVPKELSRDIMPLFDQVNWSQAHKAKAEVFDRKIWLAAPFGASQTTNNYVFVYHIDMEAWSVIPNLPIASWLVFEDEDGNEALYAGSADVAQIYKFNTNIFTDNGELIQNRFRTGRLNLGTIADFEDLEVVVTGGFKQQGDELTMTFVVDGIQNEYTIDDEFLLSQSDGSGFIGGDYIAEEYLGAGRAASTKLRWLAVLLVSQEQRKALEIEIQIENENIGANFDFNYISINQFGFKGNIKLFPSKHILSTPKDS